MAGIDGFERWLVEHHGRLARFRDVPRRFADRVALLKKLQGVLYDAGWVRFGWPVSLGGLGGDVLDRAALYDALARHGYPGRSLFEHVEILIPALERYGSTEFAASTIPHILDGSEAWCQGFSEPDAGSDLASLRTRATAVDGGHVITGRKIWTSWAVYSSWCMVLARTGAPDSRHRGLTLFGVRTDTPGVTVRGIEQANGLDELAEVTFDEVFVPESQRIGDVGGGWGVAMYILECERGTFAWQRHGYLFPRLERVAAAADSEDYESIGEALCELMACRARAAQTLRALAAGEAMGPAAAVDKLLLIDAEQSVYDAAHAVLGPTIPLGLGDGAAEWQEDWYFSRAISIYGGTQQIQRNLVAERVLGLSRR